MTVALISAIATALAAIGLAVYLARQLSVSHAKTLSAMTDGNVLLKSNFDLQGDIQKWKVSQADTAKALVDKDSELARAVAARKVLEQRHADLVVRMAEGAPLDDLSSVLQADLDKVRAMSLPSIPSNVPLPLPSPIDDKSTVKIAPINMATLVANMGGATPAPPAARITPLEKPLPKADK
jgi:hypothetical protein